MTLSFLAVFFAGRLPLAASFQRFVQIACAHGKNATVRLPSAACGARRC